MSNYYGLIFIIAGGIFLALPAVVSSDLSKRKKKCNATAGSDMLPSYRTLKYKSPIWGYFHVQKE